ncbi:hypothetical protein M0805_007375 [Coniferiporia weirii]|nr:hypothetical protein M0805_007375 [Coniferiporia weirii]
MPLNTLSAAVHITPAVVKTFYEHYKHKASNFAKSRDGAEATDDVLFDEAFHTVKSFIELSTHNTVESLQAFTNTHILSPPWAAVSPVLIPFEPCNKAADLLLEWFDPDELIQIVGGERWWQVRGLDGVEGEWVTERKFLKESGMAEKMRKQRKERGRNMTDIEMDVLKMDTLDRVMLYVHGGGYYWGSINTHRYQILKYARKMEGRVFAVNYRKAPQYPWPCPLQDVLAAYLYLIDPPASALHTPILPENVVVAGDSAGGGLCLTMLTILRDLGKPLPAGGVLISPWVDLTHSFPSVMENTATDIIPPHGFIHKPSLAWPVAALPRRDGRIAKTETYPPPEPGHADTLQPSDERIRKSLDEEKTALNVPQKEMISGADGVERSLKLPLRTEEVVTDWEPKPPKILMKDPNATPLELRSQIQLYATNEQLTHPLVSPLLQGSLGDLCPLYIIAGDHEVLRDEIIYLAHRAAYPEEFPPRKEAIPGTKRQATNVGKFTTPTKVHLQVFDGMCHVLTVFTFHSCAKYAYQSIAEFVKHVTDKPHTESGNIAFPELRKDEPTLNGAAESSIVPSETASEAAVSAPGPTGNSLKSLSSSLGPPHSGLSQGDKSSTHLYEENKASTKEHVQEHPSLSKLGPSAGLEIEGSQLPHRDGEDLFSNLIMIRQRVDIYGHVRQMERREDIPCLQMPANDIGLLKEVPARRWLTGQQIWDERFKDTAKKVGKGRRKNEEKYQKVIVRARQLGLVHVDEGFAHTGLGEERDEADGKIQGDRRWGPLDLSDENPPSSAIAARQDTAESLALLRKTLYHTAPRTVRKMPKRKAKDVIMAALDPDDDPSAPPRQSVSEQQYLADAPIHGLSLWASIMTYFTKRGSGKAMKGKDKATDGVKNGVGFAKRGSGEGSTPSGH